MTKLSSAILAVCMVMAMACTSAPITIRPDPDQPPVLIIDSNLYGRGCISASYSSDSDGSQTIDLLVATDATTDWSLSRVVGFLGDVVGAVFGGNRTMISPQGPDSVQGCDQLFEIGEVG